MPADAPAAMPAQSPVFPAPAVAEASPVPAPGFAAATGKHRTRGQRDAMQSMAALAPAGLSTPTELHAQVEGASFQQGAASWYGPGFHNRLTANGERFNMHALTAAHKTLPFGTIVRVVSPQTGKSVVVRINDRGPYAKGRIIDLSSGAADRLGLKGHGVTRVMLYKVKAGGKSEKIALNDQ